MERARLDGKLESLGIKVEGDTFLRQMNSDPTLKFNIRGGRFGSSNLSLMTVRTIEPQEASLVLLSAVREMIVLGLMCAQEAGEDLDELELPSFVVNGVESEWPEFHRRRTSKRQARAETERAPTPPRSAGSAASSSQPKASVGVAASSGAGSAAPTPEVKEGMEE